MISRPQALRYLLAASMALIASAVVTAALCIFADPYRLFDTERHLPSPTAKPRIYQQAMLAKTAMMERALAKTLLLGNSRVEIGLDPQSRSWPEDSRPVFNGGMAARTIFASLLLLQDQVAIRPPRVVVLGVDFQDYVGVGQTPADAHIPVNDEEKRLAANRDGTPNPDRDWQWFKDGLTATLSIDAITDSLGTLLFSNRDRGVTMERDGFNPLRQYLSENPASLFQKKLQDYTVQYGGFRPSNFEKPRSNTQFPLLAKIIAICKQRHIRLILFTPPYHQAYLEMLKREHLWQSFEAWKRALAAFVYAADPSVPVFDFSRYNRLTEEKVPSSGSRQFMHWYWEPGHYRSAFGDLIIADLFSANPVYARRITPRNVDNDLSSVRVEQVRFSRQSALLH